MKQDLLTVSQAARYKGVSRTAVYKAIEEKRLRSTSLLDRTVVRKADLDAWNVRPGQPVGKSRSKDVKARISASQKRRWAKRKGGS